MKCSNCNKESDVACISPVWYCNDCLQISFFDSLSKLYNSNKDRRILIVSSKTERLDQVGEYVLGAIDLFNLSNNITLIHAEGIPNLQANYTDIYIDNDLICQDWEHLIPRAENASLNWINTPTWNLVPNEKYLSNQT